MKPYTVRLLILLFSVSLFLQCNINHESKHPIEVKIISIDRVTGRAINSVYYTINMELVNNSEHSFDYWSMTCSWDGNWLFDSKSIQLTNLACDSNMPAIFHIKAGDKRGFRSWIFVQDSSRAGLINEFKLGFIYIGQQEVSSIFNFEQVLGEKKASKQNIIWSKKYKLSDFGITSFAK